MGKILIITGLVIVAAGIFVSMMRPNGLPRLPGDIYIKKEGLTFYFPIGWCVLISVVMSVIFWITRR